MSPTQGAGRGRAVQFGFGQLPQTGFRASAVHVPQCPPVARSSFLAAGPGDITASTTKGGMDKADVLEGIPFWACGGRPAACARG